MSNLEYEDKYGEKVLSDRQIEEEQRRIDEEEHLEYIDKCIKKINGILNNKELDKEALTEELKVLKELTEEL